MMLYEKYTKANTNFHLLLFLFSSIPYYFISIKYENDKIILSRNPASPNTFHSTAFYFSDQHKNKYHIKIDLWNVIMGMFVRMCLHQNKRVSYCLRRVDNDELC